MFQVLVDKRQGDRLVARIVEYCSMFASILNIDSEMFIMPYYSPMVIRMCVLLHERERPLTSDRVVSVVSKAV